MGQCFKTDLQYLPSPSLPPSLSLSPSLPPPSLSPSLPAPLSLSLPLSPSPSLPPSLSLSVSPDLSKPSLDANLSYEERAAIRRAERERRKKEREGLAVPK